MSTPGGKQRKHPLKSVLNTRATLIVVAICSSIFFSIVVSFITFGMGIQWPVKAMAFALAFLSTGLLSLRFSTQDLKSARLNEDIPTTTIGSAAQGLVELAGKGKPLPGREIRSPLSGRLCMWWDYSVWDETRDHNSWIAHKMSHELFILDDGTGDCVINPNDADFGACSTDDWFGNSLQDGKFPGSTKEVGAYRFSETLLRADQAIYVIGSFTSRPKALEPDQIAALAQAGLSNVDFMERPQSFEHYIISNKPARTIARRYRRLAILGLGFFVGLTAISLLIFYYAIDWTLF